MKVYKEEPECTGTFSSLFLDYISGSEKVADFYKWKPKPEEIGEVIRQRRFSSDQRTILTNALEEQYRDVELSGKLRQNFSLLKEDNTYTVTTGHQLNLCTGPLFFVYKILSTINLAEELAQRYPESNFVPVYWMATEDHDFEEISHFNLFGTTYTWQTSQKGAVGRFSTEGIDELLNQLPEKFEILLSAYQKGKTLSQATRILVNTLFGNYGLVILDPDSAELKRSFKEVLRSEIRDGKVARATHKTSLELEKRGYSSQVYTRDINVFMLLEDRKRLEKQENGYQILPDQPVSWEELDQMLDEQPQLFSPNVVLRPLYQETVLPNLVYIGGPAEIAYWLQLKDAFQECAVPFPMLLPRNFFMVVKKNFAQKLEQFGIEPAEIFQPERSLKDKYLESQTESVISIENEIRQLDQLFDQISNVAGTVDKSLEGFVQSEKQRMLKQTENIEKRIRKAEEQKHETVLKQIESIRKKLFPGNSLQERVENLFSFQANDPEFIRKIKDNSQPFDFRFTILWES